MSSSLLIGGAGAVQASDAPAAEAPAKQLEFARLPQVSLSFEGEPLPQKGLLVGGRTMVPVTFLRDAAGYPMTYDNRTFTYNVGNGVSQLNLATSEYGVVTSVNHFYMGGAYSDYNALNIQGRLYVPFSLLNDVLGFQGSYDAVNQSLLLEKRAVNPIRVTTGTLTRTTDDLEMLIRYPQITGLADGEVQQRINEEFKRRADAFAAEGTERSANRNPELVPFPYSYNANFAVTYNQDGVLSVLVDQNTYTGGEDPVQREALTFSLKDGRLLSLDDLLPQGSGGQEKLYALLAQQIREDKGMNQQDLQANSLQFYISGAGLQLYFSDTGPDSFAKGIETYKVPFHELLPAGTDPFAAFR